MYNTLFRHYTFSVLAGITTLYSIYGYKPLVFVMVTTTDPCSARQQRHLAFISEFTTDIQHLPDNDNVVADCVSRFTVNTLTLGIDYTAMAATQIDYEDVQAYPNTITNLQLNNMTVYPVTTSPPISLTPPVVCYYAQFSTYWKEDNAKADPRDVCVARSKQTGQPVGKGMLSLPTV